MDWWPERTAINIPPGPFWNTPTACRSTPRSIPGTQAAPLFNAKGQLIGINGRISVEKRGRVNIGAGYAISINQVMHFQDHLLSGRVVDHATLGATVTTDSEGRVIVRQILEQSEAYRRGLRSGDELVEFAGRQIRSVNQFKNVLGIYPSGWKLPLTYRRDGEQKSIIVRLRTLHRAAELNPEEEEPPPEMPVPKLPIPIPGLEGGPARASAGPSLRGQAGYANFHFNQLATDRLIESMLPWGSSELCRGHGRWT